MAARDQYGRGTWRQVRTLRFPGGGRRGNGLHPMATGPGGLSMAEPFTLFITASDDDIDELGHVNNAVWVKWIQDVATAHWMAVADPFHVDAYVWVVTRHEIDYRGNVNAGERVTARTWIPEPPRGARFDRLMEFTGEDGKIRFRRARPGRSSIARAAGFCACRKTLRSRFWVKPKASAEETPCLNFARPGRSPL